MIINIPNINIKKIIRILILVVFLFTFILPVFAKKHIPDGKKESSGTITSRSLENARFKELKKEYFEKKMALRREAQEKIRKIQEELNNAFAILNKEMIGKIALVKQNNVLSNNKKEDNGDLQTKTDSKKNGKQARHEQKESLPLQLMTAIQTNDIRTVQELLKKEVDVNYVDIERKDRLESTPLMIAVASGDVAIIELLMKSGAKVNAQNAGAFSLAIQNGRLDIVKLLIDHVPEINVGVGHPYRDLPLIIAAGRGYKEIVQFLIARGAKINIEDEVGNSPLLSATREGRKDIVEFLLENGVNPNTGNGLPLLAITQLDRDSSIKIVELLVKRGADVNVKEANGYTPLMFAVERMNKDIVKFLLAHGANINAKNNRGRTPIMIAFEASYPNEDLILLLLQRNADVNIKDNEGRNVLAQIAHLDRHATFKELLKQYGAKMENGEKQQKETKKAEVFPALREDELVNELQQQLPWVLLAEGEGDKISFPLDTALYRIEKTIFPSTKTILCNNAKNVNTNTLWRITLTNKNKEQGFQSGALFWYIVVNNHKLPALHGSENSLVAITLKSPLIHKKVKIGAFYGDLINEGSFCPE